MTLLLYLYSYNILYTNLKLLNITLSISNEIIPTLNGLTQFFEESKNCQENWQMVEDADRWHE